MKYICTQYVTYSGEVEADSEEEAREKWLEILDSDALNSHVVIESSDTQVEEK